MGQSVIYVLKCPLTGAVRYVGKTSTNMRERLRSHIVDARFGGTSRKCEWIRSLLADGLQPLMEVDAVIRDGDNWKAIERERVAFHKANGADLTNGNGGGDGSSERIFYRAAPDFHRPSATRARR